MKISIITSVYNNAQTLSECIESVLSQSYESIEYIVVDGASTDGTLDVIEKYRTHIDRFVSEPDKGIYDGLNKGIAMATGDVIGFLHSDDLYYDSDVLQKVATTFMEKDCDSLYGDLLYIDKNDTSQIVRYWKSGSFTYEKLFRGWMPPHPTFFVKRDIYVRYGTFDTNLKIAADYDSILRFLARHKISTVYIPEILVKMRVGGESNKSLKNIFNKTREDYFVLKRNDVGGLSTLLWKNLSKIPQFIFKNRV